MTALMLAHVIYFRSRLSLAYFRPRLSILSFRSVPVYFRF